MATISENDHKKKVYFPVCNSATQQMKNHVPDHVTIYKSFTKFICSQNMFYFGYNKIPCEDPVILCGPSVGPSPASYTSWISCKPHSQTFSDRKLIITSLEVKFSMALEYWLYCKLQKMNLTVVSHYKTWYVLQS